MRHDSLATRNMSGTQDSAARAQGNENSAVTEESITEMSGVDEHATAEAMAAKPADEQMCATRLTGAAHVAIEHLPVSAACVQLPACLPCLPVRLLTWRLEAHSPGSVAIAPGSPLPCPVLLLACENDPRATRSLEERVEWLSKIMLTLVKDKQRPAGAAAVPAGAEVWFP